MPSLKQKLAFNKIVENHGNVSKSMREVGYDETTAKNPKNLTESKGFKQLLKESGLTEELIATSLVNDIIEKPQNRLGELRLGSEILGMKAVDGSNNKTLVVMITGATAKRYGINTNTGDSSTGLTQV